MSKIKSTLEHNDPQVPGQNRHQEAFFAFLFGTLTISALGIIAYFADAPLIFPSLGPTAFLIFHRPTASAASPRNTLTGHFIGVISAVASLAIFGILDAPGALEAGVSLRHALAAGLSLGLTSGLMVFFRRGHPPAGATTMIVSLGLMTTPSDLIALMLAVTLLLLFGKGIHHLAGIPYPWWSPAIVEKTS